MTFRGIQGSGLGVNGMVKMVNGAPTLVKCDPDGGFGGLKISQLC